MNTCPVFLHLLADRRGRPAALVLDARGALAADTLPPALAGLAARLPCLSRAEVPEETAAALVRAGWQRLTQADVARADAPFDGTLAPGVRYVEGDWAVAPAVRPPGQQAASRALALQLVELVNRDADTHEIEALLRRDPTLSYHLLRLVNSLGVSGGARKVSSFAQAILILGRQQLRRWLNLMLFAAREGDVRSAMLLARVSVRARLMELLARAAGLDRHHQEQAFMTGMFSLLGVLFGSPLRDVLAPLALGAAVQDALLDGAGELGTLLALVQAAERSDAAALGTALQALQLDVGDFNALAAEANLWMLGVIQQASLPMTGTDNA
ncbi:EAL and HDOD domain-containing protein [Pseudoduganella chitinolytica]|uniref:HDOD domain-containing protein n=1 Tax=Pseudoduganella chitinolytica TaxID=34070 RepID=A0ABY8BE51_9BURK|nr:HDOD domain-containing protein [Pseudoduganella chitinolytica]WEF33668.1 HDOD domain-containing protein [Pseudoduganella chitinolytica]